MNLREQQNIFKLLWAGLGLVNRAGTALIVYIIFVALLNFLILFLPQLNVPSLLIQLLNICCSSFLVILLWRILAAKADNFGESFSNSITASIIPGFYLLIFNLIIGVFSAILVFVAMPILRLTHWPGLIVVGVISVYLAVRISFAVPALALREQGPVKALIYSWEMTSDLGNFFRTLLALFICALLPTLFALAVIRTLYVVIPLHFADSFNLAALTPGWYAVGGICALFFLVVSCWACATFLLFFLNRDYGENRSSYTPEPEAEIIARNTQVFGEDNNVLPPGVGKVVTQEDVHVSVTKASVKTTTDQPEITEHLDKVYKPQAEDIVQYNEEDRMPTILFDDEMAKQIEANRQMWTKKEEKNPQPEEGNDGQSIKMSK